MTPAFNTFYRLGILLFLWAELLADTPPAPNSHFSEPERDISLPIHVGVSEVAYPYSYRETNGELMGFSVDLMDAVARVMELKIVRVPLNQFSVSEALRSGLSQASLRAGWPGCRP